MAITRANLPADLQEGLNAHFGDTYRSLPNEWEPVFDTEQSNKAYEEDVLNTSFGTAPEKPEGTAVAMDETYEMWLARYLHKTYSLAFAITEEAVEDNLYQRQAPKNARALARSLKQTKEIIAANVLNNGFSTSYPIGDGAALLSASHPTYGAGNQSNILATPADFAEASLEDLLIQIMQAKDDRNINVALNPIKLIGPPSLCFDFHRVLASMGRPGTADNDINAVRDMGLLSSANVCKMTRLTDTNAWFIKTDCPEGLKYMNRVSLKRSMDDDFATGNVLYRARERYSIGASDWRAIYGTAGA